MIFFISLTAKYITLLVDKFFSTRICVLPGGVLLVGHIPERAHMKGFFNLCDHQVLILVSDQIVDSLNFASEDISMDIVVVKLVSYFVD